MYKLKRSFFFCIFACVIALLVGNATTYANNNSGPLPAVFDSSQTQSFSLDLTLIDATVSVSGGGSIKDAFFNPFGSDDIDFDLSSGSNQNKPLSLSGGTIHFVSSPNGTAILGFDHSNPNAPGNTLSGLDVDFRNGANWAFNFNEVVFDVDTDVGNYDMGLTIRANLNEFSFAQDPGSTPMNSTGFFAPGIISSGISADVDARIKDIVFGADFSIGNIASFDETVLNDFGLPASSTTLTPQGAFPSGPFPQDLLAKLDLNFPIDLEFDFSQTGVATQSNSDAVYSIPYTIQGTLVLSNLAYSLEDTLVGAIIPEPTTFLLAGLGISGMWAYRRRRWRRCKANGR